MGLIIMRVESQDICKILRFMGEDARVTNGGMIAIKSGEDETSQNPLNFRYHNSWDMLMEVWYAFRDLRFKEIDHQIWHAGYKESIARCLAYEDIAKTFEALLPAITWYSTTK